MDSINIPNDNPNVPQNNTIFEFLNKNYVCFILFIVTFFSVIELIHMIIKTPENIDFNYIQKFLNITSQILKKN